MVSKIDLPTQIVRTLDPLVGLICKQLPAAAAGFSVASHSKAGGWSWLVAR